MSQFRIFLGAPSVSDLQKDVSEYRWQTISSSSSSTSARPGLEPSRNRDIVVAEEEEGEDCVPLPPDTLEAVSVRVSLIYKNVIFRDDSEVEFLEEEDGSRDGMDETAITWPPTNPQTETTKEEEQPFLPEPDQPLQGPSPALPDDVSRRMSTSHYTQEGDSRADFSGTQSYVYSDASSIACFPTFHIKLHTLTTLNALARLSETNSANGGQMSNSSTGTRKVDIVVAVLEVEGPNHVVIKKGKDAGKEVAVLKFVVGDETGGVCKLTAWREVAESWSANRGGVLRGDIVSIENALASYAPSVAPSLTASPYLKSTLQICYRTIPHTRDDRDLRPDLRLGESDAAVRKVSATVRWFQRLDGLA